jgi:hypothetical protein
MIIECATCAVRELACHDCVVTGLLGPPGSSADEPGELQVEERAALAVLADSGLVPPLRLLPGSPSNASDGGSRDAHRGEEPPRAAGVGV